MSGVSETVSPAALKSKAVRGGSLAIGSQGARFALQTLSAIVMGRLLTPDDYGVTAMVFSISGFLSMFRYLGLSQATVQRGSIAPETMSTLFWINTGASTLLAGILIAVAPLLERFYAEPRLGPIAWTVAASFLATGLGIQHTALLQRQMRFGALALIDVSAMAVSIGLGIGFAAAGYGYWSILISQFGLQAWSALCGWIATGWRPGLPAWTEEVRQMLNFGKHVTLFVFANYFVVSLDNVLIGRVWGPSALGVYAKAYQLLLLPMKQVNAPLAPVALATLSRLRDDPVAYRRAYLRTVSLIASISMPVVAALAAASDWLMLALLGPRWLMSAEIYAVLSLAALMQPVLNTSGWLFLSQGRTKTYSRIAVTLAPLTVVAFFIGLPWGPIGVAWAFATMEVLVRAPVIFWQIGRQEPVSTRDVCVTVAPWVTTAGAIWLAMRGARVGLPSAFPPFAGLAVTALITVLAFLIVPRLFGEGRRTHAAWVDLFRAHVWRRLRRTSPKPA